MQQICCLLQNLLFAQHVSGTIMPIIRSGVELWVMCPVCGVLLEQHPPQLHTRPTTCKPKSQVPQAAAICIILELLIMGIMMSETC
jgi:hypothetical protein